MNGNIITILFLIILLTGCVSHTSESPPPVQPPQESTVIEAPEFIVAKLDINPGYEILEGDDYTIIVRVKNVGNISGDYDLKIKLDDIGIYEESLENIEPHEIREVTHTVKAIDSGKKDIAIGDFTRPKIRFSIKPGIPYIKVLTAASEVNTYGNYTSENRFKEREIVYYYAEVYDTKHYGISHTSYDLVVRHLNPDYLIYRREEVDFRNTWSEWAIWDPIECYWDCEEYLESGNYEIEFTVYDKQSGKVASKMAKFYVEK